MVLRKGSQKLIYKLLLVIVLSFTFHTVYADDGSAQAEVLNNVITVRITQNVNMGRFYAPAAGESSVSFKLRVNGSILVRDDSPPTSFSHRGGHTRGNVIFNGTPNAQINVSGPTTKIAMTGPSSDRLFYGFSGSSISAPALSEGDFSFVIQLDNNGGGAAYILGFLYLEGGALPGSYSTTFPVNVSY